MNALKRFITWLFRLTIGATFVYSGFVKGIDPWGSIYKIEDYMSAMHLPVIRNLILVGVFLLCAYEFCIGIFLLLGCFRRSAPIFACLFMAVMLPLTLWIAIADPVSDCGCFGDALIISNWATFWKNVFLSLGVVWLIKYNSSLRWFVRPHLQWIALIASAAYVIIIGLCGYIYQPLLDFRAYPAGEKLYSDTLNETEDAFPTYRLVYSKNGKEEYFGIDDTLPSEEDGWEFIRREEVKGEESDEMLRESSNVTIQSEKRNGEDKTFRIWSDDGEEDMTEEALLDEGEQIILFMPELANVSIASTWQINSLYSWATNKNIDMIGVVSATEKEIDDWRDISLASYPIYTAEDTEIKMVARGNPAVVYLKDGVIIWKSTLRALGTDDFKEEDSHTSPESFGRNNKAMLYNISALLIAVLAALAALSYVPALGKFFLSRKSDADKSETNHGDTASREE